MSVLRLGRRAMGSLFEVILVEGPRAAAEAALDEIERVEEQMSLYLPTSELCRLNARAAREEVKVEPGLFSLLRRAHALWKETGGAFDVAVAPLMQRHGFRGAGTVAGTEHVALGDGTVRFERDGVALDLGGIAKGWAVDRAVAILRAHGVARAFVHGGMSTVYALGAPPGEEGWPVGLADPRDETHRLGRVVLKDRALSASSSLGERAGHVMDPRTGRPVERAGAWVVGERATDTDALATARLVDGELRDGTILLDRRLRWRGVDVEARAEPRAVSRRQFIKTAAATAFGVGLAGAPAAAQEGGREVGVAVIGLGDQGLLLLRQLVAMKGVKVRAVCDVRKDALAEGVKVAGRDVETYEDFAYLLEEEEPEAVVIATPTHVHAAPALAALRQGVHVFCEAPLARTVDDCKAIVRARDEAKVVFQVGHQRRCSKLYPHVFTHIESGAIGNILQVRAQRNRKHSWRRPGGKDRNWRLYRESSGGLLLEQASHILDLANWYLGAVPEAATGLGAQLKWKDGRETDDSVQLLVRYPGGVQLNFGASLVNTYGDEHEIIVGEQAACLLSKQRKGLLFKEADTVSAGWEAYAKKEMLGGWRGIILDAMATKYETHEKGEQLGPDADKADYHAELEKFVASVRDGRPCPCDARAGLKAAVPAILAEEAIRQGKIIRFSKEHFEA